MSTKIASIFPNIIIQVTNVIIFCFLVYLIILFITVLLKLNKALNIWLLNNKNK